MHWLLLPLAAVMLYLGLSAPGAAMMTLWLAATALIILLWAWLQYRRVFPPDGAAVELTPLDPDELARLREQTLANRARALAERPHGVVPPAVPPVAPRPAPQPDPRPLTGRAVFVVPDEPPRATHPGTVQPGDRAP